MARLSRAFGVVAKAVILDPDLSLNAKVVYAALCCYAADDGTCFPSNPTLAEDIGCSVRSVQYAMTELAEAGLIERGMRYREGRQTSALTQLRDAHVAHRGE